MRAAKAGFDPICSVSGCGKNSKSKGLCSMHYRRMSLYGDLSANHRDGQVWKLIDAITVNPADECIPWRRSVNAAGYARAQMNGREVRVSRVICEREYGPPPTPFHHAAHSCGNSVCVNPRHIRWATPQENIDDKKIHGTNLRGSRHGLSVLTEGQVRVIKQQLSKGVKQRQLASEFEVSPSTIYAIAAGKNWGWLHAD